MVLVTIRQHGGRRSERRSGESLFKRSRHCHGLGSGDRLEGRCIGGVLVVHAGAQKEFWPLRLLEDPRQWDLLW